ncbi:MAG: FAD-binding oxidoreductase [Candidatus Hermodarchaeota archaeon]
MIKNSLYQSLAKICSPKFVSSDSKLLKKYSTDLSYIEGKIPRYIVWPKKATQIEKIIKLANLKKFSVISVSSSSPIKYHGDTIPLRDNSIVIDLSKMNKILNIDRKNRVVMIEPGVTFGQLIPILRKKGLRILTPLLPREDKSVLTAALERVPITIPRYQWDSSDPLLCTEVVFGTGDIFRTGTAAGPGTIKQQQKIGQAQVNPMGPTQFSPYRVIQGAQGSMGIVTWATLKLELLPSVQQVYHLQSNNIQELLDVQYELLKYRLCDELLILSNLNLACLLKQNSQEIIKISENLSEWNLIFVIAGRGKLAQDKLSYLQGDIDDIITKLGFDFSKSNLIIPDNDLLNVLSRSSKDPWKMRFMGAHQDIFFLTRFERIIEYISLMQNQFKNKLGVYIQALNQGTSYHCEFNIYYDPDDNMVVNTVKEKFMDISTHLMDKGAFFSRPYGKWAKDAYAHQSQGTVDALKKVKKIFDPNNILNPGVLCFDD